jgi:single-stranded DNA-binding protein
MTAFVIVTGTLHRDPVLRTAKSGKSLRRLLSGQDVVKTLFGQILQFDESAQAGLMRLKAGEAVSVQGALKVSVFEKNGVTLYLGKLP